MARLAIYNGNALVREIDVPEGVLRVGRNEQNDIVLIDPGKAVSRFHAELRIARGGCTIVDLGSQNGTWVAGRRVPQATLMPGQAAVLGTHRLVFEGDARVTEAAAPPAPAVALTPGPPATAGVAPMAVVLSHTATVPNVAPPAGRVPAGPREAKAPGASVAERPAARALPASSLDVPPRVRMRRALLLLAGSLCVAAAGVAGGLFWWPASRPAPAARTVEAPPAPVLGGPPTETPAAEAPAPSSVSPAAALAPPVAASSSPVAAARATALTASTPAAGRTSASARLTIQPSAVRSEPRPVGNKAAGTRSREVDTASMIERAQAAVRRGDYPAALGFLQPVMRVDAGNPDALDLLAAVRSQGHDAFRRGRQFDAAGRAAEAVVQYGKAVKLLPPDHPNALAARERLAVLRPQ